ncbi:hypothetical protein Q3A66_09180 [Hymenobacter sp. BT770]|uniref:hypothetical protein n=1 Tax=Hymenobacter sp. BT770 TaxID=2886942 RepID=UPI001D0FEA26|nr:hypothetical protein [Hymenobacter sp. BT770]MCC3152078.1 hypothetical protein [Hymenobacter sp. BT770]MDO3415239.1 hypothetical protein [Hymenobacter sp. BT770]
MRFFLLISLLLSLLLIHSGHAQAVGDSTKQGAQQARSSVALDSVQTVHDLFQAKRSAGSTFVGIGLGALILSPIIGALSGGLPSGARSSASGTFAVTIGVLGAGSFFIGLIQKLNYSRYNERALLAAYAKGKPLPALIRTKL